MAADDSASQRKAKRYECDVCHRWFTRSSSLTEHKYIHWNRLPFECEVCGKRFRQNSNLNKHRKLHQKSGSSHRCQDCGQVFALHSYLKSHQLSHKQTKDNLCHKCGHTFKFKSDLNRHLRIHDNRRQYKCEVCLLGFNDKSALNRHTIRVHKNCETNQSGVAPDESSGLNGQTLSSVVDYVNVCRILPVPLPNHIYVKLLEMQKQIGLELGVDSLESDARNDNFTDLLEALKDLNAIVLEHLQSIESRL